MVTWQASNHGRNWFNLFHMLNGNHPIQTIIWVLNGISTRSRSIWWSQFLAMIRGHEFIEILTFNFMSNGPHKLGFEQMFDIIYGIL